MTLVEACAVPPAPVQESVNVNGPGCTVGAANVPDVACVPLHAPEAVQPVALLELQVNVVDWPGVTLVGLAESVTVGGGVKFTVTAPLPLPPAPLQLNVKVVAVVIGPTFSVPVVARVPLHPPDAVQDVALVADHVTTLTAPAVSVPGDALTVTAGAGGGGGGLESPPPPPQAASAVAPSRQPRTDRNVALFLFILARPHFPDDPSKRPPIARRQLARARRNEFLARVR